MYCLSKATNLFALVTRKTIKYSRAIGMSHSSKNSSLKSRLSSSSFSNLFHLNKKRKRDEDEDTETSHSDGDIDSSESSFKLRPSNLRKSRKVQLQEDQKKFEELEKQYDSELPENLRKFRPRGYRFNLPPKNRPIRVYADGVFDLFHLGHMKQLEQCQKSLPNVKLICGIPSDKVTHKLKGLTVLTDKQRCESLKHCKWVDEVIPNAPWAITPEFLLKHKIDYVAHDDLPYGSADSDDIYRPVKEMGKFLVTQRTDGISTSDIITKIIRDYDQYLMRNFARGATRKELNVSWLKKNELDFKKHVNDFRSYFKKNQTNINNVSKDLYFEVREILLRKTLGKNLYSKLVGGTIDNDLKRTLQRGKRLIREKSPASEFASQFTGENERFTSSNTNSLTDEENSGDDDDNDDNVSLPGDNATTSEDADDASRSEEERDNKK